MADQLPLLAVPSAEPEWLQFLPQHAPAELYRDLVARHVARLKAEGKPWRDIQAAFDRHLLPAFGDMPVGQLESRHFITWARWALARGGADRTPLARATVQKLLSFAAGPLNDAVLARTLPFNPAHLPRGALGEPEAVDELELAREVPTLADMAGLIFDRRIDFERRLFWGLVLLTGARFGEAAALTWRYVVAHEPLNEITYEVAYDSRARRVAPTTKTGTSKHVPIHPDLQELLDEARRAWWPATFGRAPSDVDLVAPKMARRGRPAIRDESSTLRAWKGDLELLGARARKLHRSRDAFITRLTEAGADRKVVKRLTHPERRSSATSFDRYLHTDWIPRCKAVLCLRLERRSPQLDLFSTPTPGR
jgi:integrase